MNVFLTQMNEADFQPYALQSIREYAAEKQKAGTWLPDEALHRAEAEYHFLLPQGYATPNHYFFSLTDEKQQKIGIIWLHYSPLQRNREGFIYDFQIFTPYRDHGLGQSAMRTFFDYCRNHGLQKLSLHVFAHNDRAVHIYQKLGFLATDINMTKHFG
ncbi:MAG: GNAT family N-acetyltransferase [Sporolactobacillus sp.]